MDHPSSGGRSRDLEGEIARLRARVAELEERPARPVPGDAGELLAAVLDTSVMAICIVDPEGRIVFANPAAEAVLGLEPSEIVQRRYDAPEWRSTAPDGGEWPDEQYPFARVMRTGQPVHDVRHAIEWPDGRRKILSINGAPIRDASGRITSVVLCFTDVTERLEAEEALRESQERLRHAQRLESVGRLAGGVAHDFNNLLTVVSGCADLLAPEISGKADAESLVRAIRDAAERGAQLTRQLLAFARRQVVQPRVLDPSELVRGAAELLGRLLGDDVELRLRLAEDLWPVEIDPGQLEQVLVNLAVNARDAMPRGGTLTIATENRTVAAGGGGEEVPAGDWVVLSVQDTGAGIAPEVLPFVFEPFFTTKAHGHGTGLGLSTCFGIVRQAGGSIEVESERGAGSCFRVYLPRSAETAAAERDPGEAPPAMRAGRGTVLLVEDDAIVRRVTRETLDRAGYDLVEASSAREALDVLDRRGGDVDLVITDVAMPAMSGVELARELLARDPELRVLFVSGYATELSSLRASTDGRVHLLEKPYSARRLTDKVREVLSAGG